MRIYQFNVLDWDGYSRYNHQQMINGFREQFLPLKMKNCEKWAVVTTIFQASEAVKNISKQSDWCLVVVPDEKTPEEIKYGVDCFYFNKELQTKIFPILTELVPKNHFGR